MYNAIRTLDETAKAYEQSGPLGEKVGRELRDAMLRLGWDGRPLPDPAGLEDGLTVMHFLDHIKNGGAIRRREWVRMGCGWEELRVVWADDHPELAGFEGVLRPEICMMRDWEVCL